MDENMIDNYNKLAEENAKLTQTVNSLRIDIEKVKNQLSDKVPKAVLAELEGKINMHTKSLDVSSKKLFELQNNLTAYTNQPMSHTLIDTIRKQLTEEIMANTKALIDSQEEKMKQLIDEKNNETRLLVQNVKKFMYR